MIKVPHSLFTLLLLALAFIAQAQTSMDTAMVRQLGADEHGMRVYVMAYLKKGPNRSQDQATAAVLQQAHLDNIGRMAKERKLVLAGPFMDDTEVRGIYVFATSNIEEAKAWTSTDPAIQAGRLAMELHPWYGSATLLMIPELHEQLTGTK